MNNNKVLHFSDGFSLNDINNLLSENNDILYYTRILSEKNEFHVVKHKNGKFTITTLLTQLFEFYKKNENFSKLISNSTLKGNNDFTIVSNVNENLTNQLKSDLNKLLKN